MLQFALPREKPLRLPERLVEEGRAAPRVLGEPRRVGAAGVPYVHPEPDPLPKGRPLAAEPPPLRP